MLKLSTWTVLMTTLLGTLAFADPAVEVLRVTSDSKKSQGLIYRYELVTDGGKIDYMIYHNFEEETKKPKIDNYKPDQIRKGIPIVIREGRQVVIMSAPNIDAEKGGEIILDYLTNGISGNRAKYTLMVSKSSKGDWQITKDGRTVNELFFRTGKVFGKEVGVSRIEIRK
jgi:hypothetical protein